MSFLVPFLSSCWFGNMCPDCEGHTGMLRPSSCPGASAWAREGRGLGFWKQSWAAKKCAVQAWLWDSAGGRGLLRGKDPGKAELKWVLGNKGHLELQKRKKLASQSRNSEHACAVAWRVHSTGSKRADAGPVGRRIWILKTKC